MNVDGVASTRRDAGSARRGRSALALHRALLHHRRHHRAPSRFARDPRHRGHQRRRAADQSHRRGLAMDNREMVARSLAAVWHPCTQMKSHERIPLVPIARAEGAWLVRLRGPALPRRRELVVGEPLRPRASARSTRRSRDQLDTLEHVMLAGFTHAPVVELAERLARSRRAGSATRSSLPTARRPPRSRSRWRSTTGPTAARREKTSLRVAAGRLPRRDAWARSA